MLRITLLEQAPERASLRVEGRIVAEWAALLESECQALLKASATLMLDLGGVSYADSPGARVLVSLPVARVELQNPRALLHELIADWR